MNKHGIIQSISFTLAVGYLLFVGVKKGAADPKKPDAWHTAHAFVKRLDSATISTEPIDPKKPPSLAIWLLSLGSAHLTANADYFNLTQVKIRLHGRTIKDPTGDARRFYPYARLEVSDETDRGWRVIGYSPKAGRGVESVAVIVPVVIGVANPQARSNETCVIDMNPFRPFVGKFRYGRIVLKKGAASQTLALSDLLPPPNAFR